MIIHQPLCQQMLRRGVRLPFMVAMIKSASKTKSIKLNGGAKVIHQQQVNRGLYYLKDNLTDDIKSTIQ